MIELALSCPGIENVPSIGYGRHSSLSPAPVRQSALLPYALTTSAPVGRLATPCPLVGLDCIARNRDLAPRAHPPPSKGKPALGCWHRHRHCLWDTSPGHRTTFLVILTSSLPAWGSIHDLRPTSQAIEAPVTTMRGFYMQYLDSKWQTDAIGTFQIPIGTLRAPSCAFLSGPVVAGVGISDPGKHDASILSQIPCDTRQRKYLCNTPFATLVRFCCSTEGVLSDPQPRTWDRSLELRSPIDPAHARSRAPFHPHSPS